jgi:hypothetical protein
MPARRAGGSVKMARHLYLLKLRRDTGEVLVRIVLA